MWNEERHIIYMNARCFSVFSDNPLVPGHALIVPSDHITSLSAGDRYLGKDLLECFDMTFKAICSMYPDNLEKMLNFYDFVSVDKPYRGSVTRMSSIRKHKDLKKKPLSYIESVHVHPSSKKHIVFDLIPLRSERLSDYFGGFTTSK